MANASKSWIQGQSQINTNAVNFFPRRKNRRFSIAKVKRISALFGLQTDAHIAKLHTNCKYFYWHDANEIIYASPWIESIRANAHCMPKGVLLSLASEKRTRHPNIDFAHFLMQKNPISVIYIYIWKGNINWPSRHFRRKRCPKCFSLPWAY